MERLKEHRSTIVLFILLVVVFIYSAMSRGITTLNGLLQNLLILFAAVGISIFVTLMVFKRFSFKKASERELKAEDDILLQATAFSQATILIILNLIPSNDNTNLFKWLVPVAAITFYGLRAWAKLKNSNKYRYRSMLVFAVVVSFSISVIFLVFLAPFWSGLLVIDGVDNSLELVRILVLPPYILPILFVGRLRTRYGLPRQQKTLEPFLS
jgi:hypothetical protein